MYLEVGFRRDNILPEVVSVLMERENDLDIEVDKYNINQSTQKEKVEILLSSPYLEKKIRIDIERKYCSNRKSISPLQYSCLY